MALTQQYDRGCRLTVVPPDGVGIFVNPVTPSGSGLSPPQLRVQFQITRTLDLNPGRAQIQVTNLGPLSLKRIEGAVGRVGDPASLATTAALRHIDATLVPGDKVVTIADAGHASVLLEAGYGPAVAAVFRGAASSIRSTWDGVDRVTTILADDGALEAATGRVHRSFDRGTPASAILAYVAKTLALRVAPTPTALAMSADILDNGFVAYGYARDALVDLLSPLQLEQEWWIDDGAIWIVPKGQPLPLPPKVVSTVPAEGASRLLAAPEGVEDGGVMVRMLLTNALKIGQAVTLVAGKLSGAYRCEAIAHSGDNRGGVFETAAILRQPTPF